MLKGLYKVDMETVHGSRRGVLYVYEGKMMGGNLAFAFIGTYRESAGEVFADLSTLRHKDRNVCCVGWTGNHRRQVETPV